jgi:hypothetical protein
VQYAPTQLCLDPNKVDGGNPPPFADAQRRGG